MDRFQTANKIHFDIAILHCIIEGPILILDDVLVFFFFFEKKEKASQFPSV